MTGRAGRPRLWLAVHHPGLERGIEGAADVAVLGTVRSTAAWLAAAEATPPGGAGGAGWLISRFLPGPPAVAEGLARLAADVPVLLLVGGRDRSGLALARAARSRPGGEAVFGWRVRPDALLAAIRAWWAAAAGGGPSAATAAPGRPQPYAPRGPGSPPWW